jgi:hypothetical protein
MARNGDIMTVVSPEMSGDEPSLGWSRWAKMDLWVITGRVNYWMTGE